MKWYKHLFLGESIKPKKNKVIRKLNTNVLMPDVYVIVLALDSKDNFHIIPSLQLLQKNFPKDDLFVIGIAKGKDEAFALIEEMIHTILASGTDIDHIKDYFKPKGGLL